MQIPIHSVAELGQALRAVRRSSKVRLDDMAAIAGVSKQFASDLERGKETVRMGLIFKLLDEMGLRLSVDIPDESVPEFGLLRIKPTGTKAPRKPRREPSTKPGPAPAMEP